MSSDLDDIRRLVADGPATRIRVTAPRALALSWWTGTRLLAALVLVPVVVGFLGWVGGGLSPTLVLAGVVGGLTLTTYIPSRRQSLGDTFGGECGLVSALTPLAAAMALDPALGTGAGLALIIVSVGLLRRIVGPQTCSR